MQTEFQFDFRKGPRQILAGPGWSTPEEVEPNFLFCKPNFLFRFGSIDCDREKHAGVGDSPHRDVQEDYREVQSLQQLDHYPAHRNRRQRGSKTKLLLFFSLSVWNQAAQIANASQTRESNASKDGPVVVCPANCKTTESIDFSGWWSIVTFLYLFLFRSLLRLTFLLSPSKRNEKLNFSTRRGGEL